MQGQRGMGVVVGEGRTEESGQAFGGFEEGACSDGIALGLVNGHIGEVLLECVEEGASGRERRSRHGCEVSKGGLCMWMALVQLIAEVELGCSTDYQRWFCGYLCRSTWNGSCTREFQCIGGSVDVSV